MVIEKYQYIEATMMRGDGLELLTLVDRYCINGNQY
jgi:hypothetical protein